MVQLHTKMDILLIAKYEFKKILNFKRHQNTRNKRVSITKIENNINATVKVNIRKLSNSPQNEITA